MRKGHRPRQPAVPASLRLPGRSWKQPRDACSGASGSNLGGTCKSTGAASRFGKVPQPAAVFGGDTVIAFAGVATRTHAPAVRMLATDAQGVTTKLARGEADAPCPGDRLPRIAASHRMASADDPDLLVLAIDYQLMSKQTNCILVHRRADADKTTEQAELHRVSSMLAAGWGGDVDHHGVGVDGLRDAQHTVGLAERPQLCGF